MRLSPASVVALGHVPIEVWACRAGVRAIEIRTGVPFWSWLFPRSRATSSMHSYDRTRHSPCTPYAARCAARSRSRRSSLPPTAAISLSWPGTGAGRPRVATEPSSPQPESPHDERFRAGPTPGRTGDAAVPAAGAAPAIGADGTVDREGRAASGTQTSERSGPLPAATVAALDSPRTLGPGAEHRRAGRRPHRRVLDTRRRQPTAHARPGPQRHGRGGHGVSGMPRGYDDRPARMIAQALPRHRTSDDGRRVPMTVGGPSPVPDLNLFRGTGHRALTSVRRLAEVDQGHMGLLVGGVVVGVETGALGAEGKGARGERLSGFRVDHGRPDLGPYGLRHGLVGRLRQRTVQGRQGIGRRALEDGEFGRSLRVILVAGAHSDGQ